jgi:hypothetical protein
MSALAFPVTKVSPTRAAVRAAAAAMMLRLCTFSSEASSVCLATAHTTLLLCTQLLLWHLNPAGVNVLVFKEELNADPAVACRRSPREKAADCPAKREAVVADVAILTTQVVNELRNSRFRQLR